MRPGQLVDPGARRLSTLRFAHVRIPFEFQWAEQGTLHRHCEKSRFLAAVRRRHRGGERRRGLAGAPSLLFTQTSPCPLSRLSQKIDAQAIEEFYGLTSEISKNSESGYILFYQSRD